MAYPLSGARGCYRYRPAPDVATAIRSPTVIQATGSPDPSVRTNRRRGHPGLRGPAARGLSGVRRAASPWPGPMGPSRSCRTPMWSRCRWSRTAVRSAQRTGRMGDRRMPPPSLRQAGLTQPLELIVLEGDQRRREDRRSVDRLPGDLVDRAPAATGREQRQRGASVEDRSQGLGLAGQEAAPSQRLPSGALDSGSVDGHQRMMPGAVSRPGSVGSFGHCACMACGPAAAGVATWAPIATTAVTAATG